MIFVVEHDKDHRRQITIVQGVEDLDTSQYQPVRKIFLRSEEHTSELQSH